MTERVKWFKGKIMHYEQQSRKVESSTLLLLDFLREKGDFQSTLNHCHWFSITWGTEGKHMNKEALIWGQMLLNQSLLEGGVLKTSQSHQSHWGKWLFQNNCEYQRGVFWERKISTHDRKPSSEWQQVILKLQEELSHWANDNVITPWDMALEPLTKMKSNGRSGWICFCPGSDRFQSLNKKIVFSLKRSLPLFQMCFKVFIEWR